MSECEQARQLSAYHDGEVAGPDRERLEAHLGQCPACQAEARRLRRLSDLVAGAAAQPVPPEVLARLHRQAGRLVAADVVRIAKASLAVAASVLLVCALWLWQQGAGPSGPAAIPVWETAAVSPRDAVATASGERLAQWILRDLERENGHD